MKNTLDFSSVGSGDSPKHVNQDDSSNERIDTSNTNKVEPLTPFLGAIVGDIAGSIYEGDNCKSENCTIFQYGFPTDDSVLTLATADYFLKKRIRHEDGNPSSASYAKAYHDWGRSYPYAGYGGNFRQWLRQCDQDDDDDGRTAPPYNSWGNGSAMRVSPVGWVARSIDEAMDEAARSAAVTHNHPAGVAGAQALATAIFLARTVPRNDKDQEKQECPVRAAIKTYLTETFGYDLNRTVAQIRPKYEFDVSCPGSVPEAVVAFLDSRTFEDAIRKAISLGGDSDTIACMTGAMAHAYYRQIPQYMVDFCRSKLDERQLAVQDEFWKQYQQGNLYCSDGDDDDA